MQSQSNSSVITPGAPFNFGVEHVDHFFDGHNHATTYAKFNPYTLTTEAGPGSYTTTAGGSATTIAPLSANAAPVQGGWLIVTTGSGADDGITCGHWNGKNGTPVGGWVYLKAGRKVVHQWEVAIGDIDATRWFFGLCQPLAGNVEIYDASTSVSDYIGFFSGPTLAEDGTAPDGSIYYACAKNAGGSAAIGDKTSGETEGDTGENLSGDAAVSSGDITNKLRLSIVISGTTSVQFFVNEVLKATVKTNIPDDVALSECFGVYGDGAASEIAYLNYVRTLVYDE